ncbi:hypothetical protein [Tabrizicola sp.]|jgi:hypothetical protein
MHVEQGWRWEVDVTSRVQISRNVAQLKAIPAIVAAHPDKVKRA